MGVQFEAVTAVPPPISQFFTPFSPSLPPVTAGLSSSLMLIYAAWLAQNQQGGVLSLDYQQ